MKIIVLKERLKKIKWLRKSVRVIKSILFELRRPFDRALSTYYLKKSKHRSSEKVRIGFIAQIAWSWDKLEKVYEAAVNRDDIETFLFVVPEDNFDTYEIAPDYENNYFCSKYPKSIKLLDNQGNCLDILQFHLDYLFYQRPFDYRIPKMVNSVRMVKYVKCCYLPYGFTASDAFNYNNLKNSFFDNQYFIFMDSLYMKSLFQRKYSYSIKKGIRKVEYLGYPGLEKYLFLRNENNEDGYITWTPRWSFDSEQGGSTFLKYRNNFLKFVSKTTKKVIFRPHPLIYSEMIRHNIMSEVEWEEYLDKLRRYNVLIDIQSPIDDILRKTDILITDFSTIIGSFFMTGRPIIYCENGIVFNPVYEEIKKYIYVANEWCEVEKYYNRIISGDDQLMKSRNKYIDDNYMYSIGSSTRIVNQIYEDWRNKC